MISRDDLLYDLASNVGQSKGTAVVLKRQAFVIEAHQVEHRGVQVVDVDLAFDSVIAKVVCRTVRDAALHAAASQPHREAVMIVLTAVSELSVRRTSEFATP